MQMKALLNEWKKYLVEETANNFEHNFNIIASACQNTATATASFYAELTYWENYRVENEGKNINDPAVAQQINNNVKEKLRKLLIDVGAEPILRNYKIEKMLGAGSIGIAFSLEEPHQDYIIKFQITHRRVGAEHILDIYNRQEKGEFKPNEVRVLDAVDGSYAFMGTSYKVNLFVMSKVAMKNIAGKTGGLADPEDFMNDLYVSSATDLVELLLYLKENPNLDALGKKIHMSTFKHNSSLSDEQIQSLVDVFEKSSIENVARLFYKLKGNDIHMLSRDQFVALFKEFYEQAIAARKAGRPFDFHGGNFGFRPKSDVPLPFDI